LQRTVFFYVGLNFVLRGGQEHYDLLVSLFTRVPPDRTVYNKDVYYEYREFISKNNQHRYKDINIRSKDVKGPANNHCKVKLSDKYLPLPPPDSPYL